MAALTREQILGRKPKRLVVEVPEWEGSVLIEELSVAGAQLMTVEHNAVDFVIASVINEDGTPMFSPEDRPTLLRKEFSACKRIAEAAISFNALSQPAVEAIAKNSEPGLMNGSSTA